MRYVIKCVSCHSEFQESETITRCLKCGQALDIQFDIPRMKQTINEYILHSTPPSAQKYLNFYPLNDRTKIISLNEGGTPLVRSEKLSEKYGIPNLYIKNEGANPTGVFKDRGTLVEVSKALELGAKGIVVASTGNMAASVSAYSAKAGIPCYVLVPENTPLGKLSQSLVHGGKVIKVRGTYADCVRLSEEMAKKYDFLLAGDYAFRSEGQKSIAYEIIEQLNWNVPDVVIAPVGCGTNLYGIAKGFFEWYEMGLIPKIPRIIGSQPEKADTMCSALHAGETTARKIARPTSLCSAVNIGVPLDDMKLMAAIRRSQGDFEMIDDTTVLEAQLDMAKLASVFTEPSGAIPIACLKKMIANGKIKTTDTVVCVATGTGLKDPYSATLLFPNLPAVDASMNDIDVFLNSGISEIQSQKGNQDIIFSFAPTQEELTKTAFSLFGISAEKNQHILEELWKEVQMFFELKKEMRKSELHAIIEDVVSSNEKQNPILEVIDFTVETGLKQKAKACIKIQFQGKELEGCGEGVGPVDAILSTMKTLLKEHSQFEMNLTDYRVHVPSGGTDATVQVSMSLSVGEEEPIQVSGVSSDIVVASIMAYQKGFLKLWK